MKRSKVVSYGRPATANYEGEWNGGRSQEFDQVDQERIDLTDDAEIREWSATLGVSKLELQAAVEKVGPVVDDVRHFLGKA